MLKHIGFSLTIVILALAGILTSYILAEEYYYQDIPTGIPDRPGFFTPVSDAVCGDNGSFMNCATVSASKWSTIFNIPLAVHGIFYYAVLTLIAFIFMFSPHNQRPAVTVLIFWVTAIGITVDVLLFYISYFKIHSLCPLCIGTYAFTIFSFIAVSIYLWKNKINPIRIINYSKTFYFNGNIKSLISKSVFTVVLFMVAFGIAYNADYYLKISKERFYLEKKKQAFSNVIEKFIAEKEVTVNLPETMIIGDINAPVKIIEFSDFLCPYCAKTGALMDELVADNPKKVCVVFFNYPLDITCNRFMKREMHQGACLLAKGAICASQQNLFEDYQRLVFSIKPSHPSLETMENIALYAGLGVFQFQSCMDDPETDRQLLNQIREAKRIGVSSTPSIFINGKRYRAKVQKDLLQTIIDLEYSRLAEK